MNNISHVIAMFYSVGIPWAEEHEINISFSTDFPVSRGIKIAMIDVHTHQIICRKLNSSIFLEMNDPQNAIIDILNEMKREIISIRYFEQSPNYPR